MRVRWPLLVELYRTGRGPHWDPERDDQLKETLLWRCYIAAGAWSVNPPMPVKDFPYGYHWLIKDARGRLVGVAINQVFPYQLVFEAACRCRGLDHVDTCPKWKLPR